jgi:formate-dependent nitrite reductase membrane component NrfD
MSIQSSPFEFMVKYTPQREWIEGKGVLLWLAFFFIELGAGMFVIASLFESIIGMFTGWLICGLLGGGCHILYLGKPLNFYRAFLRPSTSWISRGMSFVMGFLILGFVHMILVNWVTSFIALLVIINILAFLTVIYGGFAMNFVNGIPLWNTALLPILYVAAGFWGGAELASGVAATTGIEAEIAHYIASVLLLAIVLIIPSYLISVRYGSSAGSISAREIVVGKGWPLFWFVVVVIGILFPICASLSTFIFGVHLTLVVLWIAIICGLLGDLSMRFLLLKNGYYAPLTPISDVPSSPL